MLVKVPPEETETSPTVPLLESAVVASTAALPSVPFTATLPVFSCSLPFNVPSMNRLPPLRLTSEFKMPSALIPMLPEARVLPFITVSVPVLVMVTLPPSTPSCPTVTLSVTWGDPLVTVAASVAPGKSGFQFVPSLNSLLVLPVHTDWANDGIIKVSEANAVNRPRCRENTGSSSCVI
ncbi:hypothetical protein D3C80_1405630 [compost metagenome]